MTVDDLDYLLCVYDDMLLNMRAYEIIFVVICLLLQVSVPDAFVVADMSYFPDIMITTRAIADQTALAIDALRQASVPMTLDSALSIGISEVFAGVTAGAITRRTADLLGDKKKDTFRTKVSTTGAFFGARGLARGLARLAVKSVTLRSFFITTHCSC